MNLARRFVVFACVLLTIGMIVAPKASASLGFPRGWHTLTLNWLRVTERGVDSIQHVDRAERLLYMVQTMRTHFTNLLASVKAYESQATTSAARLEARRVIAECNALLKAIDSLISRLNARIAVLR